MPGLSGEDKPRQRKIPSRYIIVAPELDVGRRKGAYLTDHRLKSKRRYTSESKIRRCGNQPDKFISGPLRTWPAIYLVHVSREQDERLAVSMSLEVSVVKFCGNSLDIASQSGCTDSPAKGGWHTLVVLLSFRLRARFTIRIQLDRTCCRNKSSGYRLEE
jgi:hypothetical protein